MELLPFLGKAVIGAIEDFLNFFKMGNKLLLIVGEPQEALNGPEATWTLKQTSLDRYVDSSQRLFFPVKGDKTFQRDISPSLHKGGFP